MSSAKSDNANGTPRKDPGAGAGSAPPRPSLAEIEPRLVEAGASPRGLAHGRDCAALLAELGLGEGACIAALLHYGSAGIELPGELAQECGAEVRRIADAVARLDSLAEARGDVAGGARAERLRRLLFAIVRDVRVVLVVIAARLIELRRRDLIERSARRPLAERVVHVYAPLASRLGVWQVKWELEDLAFRELEPEVYKEIAGRLDARRGDRERYIDVVVGELESALEATGIEGEVSGRPKHIYSIWRKMRGKGLGFEQIFDLRAVRVLVDDVPACYAALGVVHSLWSHVPGEFDDYIANPKPNGYRSLHTAVMGPEGMTLEVQIRTREMHAEAELGIAAHWRYKEGGRGRDSRHDAHVRWMRRLLESSGEDTGDLMEQFNAELFQDRVYVFTPRGDIVDLPDGATPLDFAYQVHTEVGHRCRGAKVNGTMVQLTHRLRSGDKVEVLTTRQPRPSRDWINPHLGYLVTARARNKVRQWFRQQDYERNLADGQEIYAREVRRLGVTGIDGEALAQRFKFSRFDDLLAAIGGGDVSHGQLAGALQQQVPPAPPTVPPRARARPRAAKKGAVQVEGVGDLLVQMARCCRPLPPDGIVGYITRGRGVSIHRRDCGNVLRLGDDERPRLIDVGWREGAAETYPVEVAVSSYDRRGLLRDITSVIANEGVNVVALESRGRSEHQEVETVVTVEVEDLTQLARVLDRLAQLPNVTDVRRRA